MLGGDYNVIRRDHRPGYRGFLPFEYAMLDALEDHGMVDAQRCCSPGVQEYSWIGRVKQQLPVRLLSHQRRTGQAT